MKKPDIDLIDLEVLRSRLETVGDQACRAIEQTAVSPAVTEQKDYSVTLMDAGGGLIIGAGVVLYHMGAAVHAVRSTIQRYGAEIRPGDVFFANDPHSGGGLHPQDVMVQQPIFVGDRLIAWVGTSAHLMDMGGMVVGSFAPYATECYQEAFRIPPVRLFREGVEVSDVWDLLRTNVRMADLVEMDLRGLVAGAHHASDRIAEVVELSDVETFVTSLAAIRDLSEAEMRRRISTIADGVYRATSWTEYWEEFYKLPCTLTVAGDTLTFDFEGASPQCQRFFNSKPYIVGAELVAMIWQLLAPDLPFNDGLFAPITIRCPEGSIVNARPPAPISAAHMHVSLNAAGVAMQALTYALGASPNAAMHRYLGGASWASALATQIWSWTDAKGESDAFLAMDANWVGGSAGAERDGKDLGGDPVGPEMRLGFADIEVLESWFPLLFIERRACGGAEGAGRYRAGGGNHLSFRPHGVDEVMGTVFGMRRWLPLQGLGGGRPGACNELVIHRAEGAAETLNLSSTGAVMREGDWFELRMASGGGFGDPLDRDPALVEIDVARGRFDAAVAREAYGVVAGDRAATEALRASLRRDRLSRADPALKPLPRDGLTIAGEAQPLYPGIVQRDAVAIAEASGAPLAMAPDHWTDGCPCLVERRWGGEGPPVKYSTWLDPETGRALHVEASVGDAGRGFLVAPARWTTAETV
jgi:N-methylhydantoinase B